MQTCQINFAGREGCDCCKIASPLKELGVDCMAAGCKGMLEMESLRIFIILKGSLYLSCFFF